SLSFAVVQTLPALGQDVPARVISGSMKAVATFQHSNCGGKPRAIFMLNGDPQGDAKRCDRVEAGTVTIGSAMVEGLGCLEVSGTSREFCVGLAGIDF